MRRCGTVALRGLATLEQYTVGVLGLTASTIPVVLGPLRSIREYSWKREATSTSLDEVEAPEQALPAREAAAAAQRAAAGLKPLPNKPVFGPPKQFGRHGPRLLQHRPDQFERMRVILGYYDLPTSAGKVPSTIHQVTINALQPLQYLDANTFPPGYRQQLVAYRVAGLNRELAEHMQRTRKFLSDQQSGADQDVAFDIPGI